jgi:hypothetical protein
MDDRLAGSGFEHNSPSIPIAAFRRQGGLMDSIGSPKTPESSVMVAICGERLRDALIHYLNAYG